MTHETRSGKPAISKLALERVTVDCAVRFKMDKLRNAIDGKQGQGNKVTTKSGHISDVKFEPNLPLLEDDDVPSEQYELDKLDEELQRSRTKKSLLATPSGVMRDKLDSLLNKRLEERINQLRIFRTQIAEIQLKNKRDQLAKSIEIKKVVDKLARTKQRLQDVMEELKQERSEELTQPREVCFHLYESCPDAVTGHAERCQRGAACEENLCSASHEARRLSLC